VAIQERNRTRIAAVVFAGFCAFLTLFAPQPLLPMLAVALGKPEGAIASYVITPATLAVALAAPFAGVIADHLGRKRVIVWSALLLSVPTVLTASANGMGQLLVWRALQGVFTPGIFAVTIAYINEEWEEGAGSAMAAYVGGTVMGGFTGRVVAALAAAEFSWRWSFVALGVLDALMGVAIWVWLPEGRHFKRAVRTSTARAMSRHLRNPRLAATYAVGFCVLFTLMAAFSYVTFYLAAPPFRLSTQLLGLTFVVYLVGAAVTPVAGRSIDRLGHRFALSMAYCGGIAGICLTLIAWLPAVLLGLALCCTGVFIAHSSASSYIGTVAHEARAAAVGLYVMFYYVGGSAGAALPGYLWHSGGWPGCVALVVAVQALTIVLALVFWRPEPQPAPQPAVAAAD